MSITIYIVENMSADTVTTVSQTLGVVKETTVAIATIVIPVTIVAHIAIDPLGLKVFTDRLNGFMRILITRYRQIKGLYKGHMDLNGVRSIKIPCGPL